MTKKVSPKTSGGVRRGERLTNCSRDRCGRRYNAFTLIELLVVVSIIAVLGALVLSTAGYARKKGARARAETEIAAMSAACENYKADNGIYPRDSAATTHDALNAQNDPIRDPSAASRIRAAQPLPLQRRLLGGELHMADRSSDQQSEVVLCCSSRTCCSLPTRHRNCHCNRRSIRKQLRLLDRNQAATQDTTKGYNPTFDLWSTAGRLARSTRAADQKLVRAASRDKISGSRTGSCSLLQCAGV